MKTTLFILFLFAIAVPFTASASKNQLNCTAKVALNRTYEVQLTKDTRVLEIKTDNGFHYIGNATYQFNPQRRENNYTIYYHYNLALQLTLEEGGQERVGLCLTASECYACR